MNNTTKSFLKKGRNIFLTTQKKKGDEIETLKSPSIYKKNT